MYDAVCSQTFYRCIHTNLRPPVWFFCLKTLAGGCVAFYELATPHCPPPPYDFCRLSPTLTLLLPDWRLSTASHVTLSVASVLEEVMFSHFLLGRVSTPTRVCSRPGGDPVPCWEEAGLPEETGRRQEELALGFQRCFITFTSSHSDLISFVWLARRV